jgi:receptor protein-tyrosine kinase
MSLIEQAAKRLEELRRAGAETSDSEPESAAPKAGTAAAPEHLATPEAAVRGLGARGTGLTKRTIADTAEPAPQRQRVSAAKASQPRLEIDLEGLKNRGFVTPDMTRSQLADEFRIVKRPIVRNAFGSAKVRNGNLVMVASALPGEGKTFTAVNLVMSIAMELDTTVLLVDGDVAHPDLPNILGTRKSPGLLELLTRDDLDIDDVVVQTNIENLSVMPAGAQQLRATELLASEQMAIVLRDLSTRYPDRIIVFDSPPLLPTTEARVLASHMGQIVMVVAADSTKQNTVNLALETIERCEVVLMLLNKADKTDVGSYYGYYGHDATR